MKWHLLATIQVVDPGSGEILAMAGQEDPPRLMEELRHCWDAGKPVPAWLEEQVNLCYMQEKPWNLTDAEREAIAAAASDLEPVYNGPPCRHGIADPYDCVTCSAEQFGGSSFRRCRHGYLPSECPVCSPDRRSRDNVD